MKIKHKGHLPEINTPSQLGEDKDGYNICLEMKRLVEEVVDNIFKETPNWKFYTLKMIIQIK